MDAHKHWIQTFTGQKFFPLAPELERLDIRDIARALSMLCRYGGHVQRFYSVAEHCVRIVERLQWLYADRKVQQWGLLHDASEAYLGDVVRPVKVQPEFGLYREAESRLMELVIRKFELLPSEPEVVTALDTEILGTEALALKTPVHPDWSKSLPNGMPAAWSLQNSGLGWSPTEAEDRFLKLFERLFGSAQFYHATKAPRDP